MNSWIFVRAFGIKIEGLESSFCFHHASQTNSGRSDVPIIDLETLFRNLPQGTTVETKESDSFFWFSFGDTAGNLPVKVLVGEFNEKVLDPNGRCYLEGFQDAFKLPGPESRGDQSGIYLNRPPQAPKKESDSLFPYISIT